MTQERLETSWNCRPMVGSAVATMVWSSAARNIASIRLTRMARTSSGVSGARGAIGGASEIAITSVGISASSASISSAKLWGSAGRRLCRSCLFMGNIFVRSAAKAAQIRCCRASI